MASDTLPETISTAHSAPNTAEPRIEDTETTGFTSQTLGGVFDSAFDLYKQNFGVLALIVACVFIPTQVVLHAAGNIWLRPLMAQYNASNPDFGIGVQIFSLAVLIGAPQAGIPGYVSLLTSFMACGPVAVAVANILVGRPLSMPTAYRRAVPVLWRLFWTWNLFFLVYVLVLAMVAILLFIILAIIGASGMTSLGGEELGVVILVLMLVTPYLACCLLGTAMFAFAPPLIALENFTVLGAVERNSQLVAGKFFWRMSIAITLLPVVIFGLQFLMLLSASSVVESLKWPAWAGFVVGTGLSSVISFFFQPYWMIFMTLLYFDCRVRREGLDVRYLADNLPEVVPTPTREEVAQPVPLPSNLAGTAVHPLPPQVPPSPSAGWPRGGAQ